MSLILPDARDNVEVCMRNSFLSPTIPSCRQTWFENVFRVVELIGIDYNIHIRQIRDWMGELEDTGVVWSVLGSKDEISYSVGGRRGGSIFRCSPWWRKGVGRLSGQRFEGQWLMWKGKEGWVVILHVITINTTIVVLNLFWHAIRGSWDRMRII